ncbi:hypothetical protein [Mechercharimyces sp. CAU 1602]|uniref:hypothetical protein n=1 Tax=Mechercharimyces sp. CAU 1602 TaxID=2973933 RepID=UPI002867F5E7|nr:hypothetical protein [Mechercharimyces sp. CAU 1602]MCS1350100.1 hypothetical protein [Mechercharimyces sp. CAU 1602]
MSYPIDYGTYCSYGGYGYGGCGYNNYGYDRPTISPWRKLLLFLLVIPTIFWFVFSW